MKSVLLKVVDVSAAVLLCMVYAKADGETAESKGFDVQQGVKEVPQSVEKRVDSNVLNTIAYINQMNYAYVVMKTYHNPIAIQEQYERLALDKIDITSIPNHTYEGKSMKELILDMQDKLKALSIADKDYQYYKECQEGMARNARKRFWWKIASQPFVALSNAAKVTQKGVGKADGYTLTAQVICSLAGDLIGGPVKTIGDYQTELDEMRASNKDHEFKYDKDKERAVHEANQMLLSAEYDFVNQYKLKREEVITPDELQKMIDVLKGGDQGHIYSVLNRPETRKRLDAFSPYWYYLSLAALNTAHYDVAVEASDKFFAKHRGLMKVDPMVAQAAVVHAAALLGKVDCDKGKITAKVGEKLAADIQKICDVNFTQANSDQSYFCAEVYYRYLDKPDEARRIIEASIARLEEKFSGRLMEYRNKYRAAKGEEKKQWENVPSDTELFRAHALYAEILQGKKSEELNAMLEKIIARETTSALEKFFYVGSVRNEDLWKEAEKDILNMGLWHFRAPCKANRFYLEVPVSWFILGEVKPTLTLMRGANVVVKIEEVENFMGRKLMKNKVGIGESIVSIEFIYGGSLVGVDSVVLDFPHESWPIKIVYRPTFGFDVGEGESEDRMTTYKPDRVWFMGEWRDFSALDYSVREKIQGQKIEGYIGGDRAPLPFRLGEINYVSSESIPIITATIEDDWTMHVAFVNTCKEKSKVKVDVKYFAKFGALIWKNNFSKRLQPESGDEYDVKWPEELRGVEAPAFMQIQYRGD